MSGGAPLYRLPRGGRDEAASIVLAAAAAVVVMMVLAMWVATQYAAIQFHFHPGLGPPLLTVTPPHRVWLAAAAAVVAALGAASLTSGRCRRWAGWLFLGAGALFALRIGPPSPPLHFFFWWGGVRHSPAPARNRAPGLPGGAILGD